MNPRETQEISSLSQATPLCAVFGECGGCTYQHIPYSDELQIKEKKLKELLQAKLPLSEDVFEEIVASPKDYHYRHRLDITLKRSKGEILFGFQSPMTHRVVSIETCPIAMESVADFVPRLREESFAKLPEKYRTANLVVRTGDDGRVLWGGIGRHSLVMKEEDYFWTEIESKKIFYSLETFFQANLSILPRVIQKIREWVTLDLETFFLDLYSGVGLFGLCFAKEVGKVMMIEENPGSIHLARYNVNYHQLKNVEIFSGQVENELQRFEETSFKRTVAMIDPPRAGLSAAVSEALSQAKYLESLLYLSCHPESLARDLEIFIRNGWRVETVVPLDFFPRTHHLETLVLLKPSL